MGDCNALSSCELYPLFSKEKVVIFHFRVKQSSIMFINILDWKVLSLKGT